MKKKTVYIIICMVLAACCVPCCYRSYQMLSTYNSVTAEIASLQSKKVTAENSMKQLTAKAKENSQNDITNPAVVTKILAENPVLTITGLSAYKAGKDDNAALVQTFSTVSEFTKMPENADMLEYTMNVSDVSKAMEQLDALHVNYQVISYIAPNSTLIVRIIYPGV